MDAIRLHHTEEHVKNILHHFFCTLRSMCTIEEYLWFDDRNDVIILTDARVTCEHKCVRIDTLFRRNTLTYGNNTAPLRKLCTVIAVIRHTIRKRIEALGQFFIWKTREVDQSLINFYSWHYSRFCSERTEWSPVISILPKCLIVKNDSRQYIFRNRSSEQDLPISPAIIFRFRNANRSETFICAPRRLICSKNSPTLRY